MLLLLYMCTIVQFFGTLWAYECYGKCSCVADIGLISCTGLSLGRTPTMLTEVSPVFKRLDLRRNNIQVINLLDVMEFSQVDLRFNPLDCRSGILNRGLVETNILTDCPDPLVDHQTVEELNHGFHSQRFSLKLKFASTANPDLSSKSSKLASRTFGFTITLTIVSVTGGIASACVLYKMWQKLARPDEDDDDDDSQDGFSSTWRDKAHRLWLRLICCGKNSKKKSTRPRKRKHTPRQKWQVRETQTEFLAPNTVEALRSEIGAMRLSE